ncbi:pleckstrin homology domain-containing family M member 2 isoform X2 [Cryptotermes secundus]|uniref:pleckstrin homology domain-containing family M member 2 isoform X2 n=1 Tax=Cryptotermes secundus TaxID=105785 RepID=UPI001454C7EF|nr:pleckstrin homology domain-containing family M member 2 isoform X2 [Cryptotermes secundus]
MELHDDKNGVKDGILDDLGKSIKLVQRYALCGCKGIIVIDNDSWPVQALCHLLDLVLRHGLQDWHHGFWPVVCEFSHSDTLRVIQSLKSVNTSLGKGRAWLYHTLTEGSLQSYLHCLSQDVRILCRHYVTQALIRDTPRTQQLLTLLAGLEHVQFNLYPDAAYLDMAAYQQHTEVSSDVVSLCGDPSNFGLHMTSSVTSSLTSPVDSGVALLDSDADNTSVSEATMNETDCLSLRDDREDDSGCNEIEDNRINHQLQTLDTHMGKGYTSEECCVNTHTEADQLHAATKEEDCGESDKPAGAGALRTTPAESGNEVVAVSDIFRSHSLSVMTASDIANQNVIENSIIPPVLCSAPSSFVESKNRVNTDMTVMEERKTTKASCMPKQGTDGDDIVFRRQRNKKKRNNIPPDGTTKVKRVSFHEDFIRTECESAGKCGPDFSVSFLPPNSVIKRDVVKGRYSWCGEGDAPFMRRRNNESGTKSDIYLSASNLTSSDETISMEDPLMQLSKNTNNTDSKQKDKYAVSETAHAPPVTERGTPEGQEDPPVYSSSLCLHKHEPGGTLAGAVGGLSGSLSKFSSFLLSADRLSDSESIPASDSELFCSSTVHLTSSSFKENHFLENSGCQSLLGVRPAKLHSCHHHRSRKGTPLGLIPPREVASKSSLLTRFMRSLTEKKFMQKKPKVALKPSRSLYIPGARKLDRTEVLEQFITELHVMGHNVEQVAVGTPDLEETFRTQVFLDSLEVLYKVFKVSSSYYSTGIATPLLALLTNINLYLIGVKSNYTYCNKLVMPYTDLDAMLVGPNMQTVLLVSADRQTQFLLVTGDHSITEQLVGHIEIAMRRAPTKPTLPAVRVLELEDMKGLAQDISVLAGEAICHYSIVHLQDHQVSPPSTPLGPTKEGHLMFRPATDTPLQPWEPGFFMLKAGVVYMFGDKSCHLPKRWIPLRGNGCRRIPHAHRPHTFEIILGPRRSFQFAAADEYEASDWLQAFIQAASGVHEEGQAQTMCCSLVVTTHHIITCLERFAGCAQVQTLSCAAIQDLTAFTVESLEHSWCVLEFACREVHEGSGDSVLYFASAGEMRGFMDILQHLWLSLQQTEFPLCPMADTSLGRRCRETSTLLAGAWDVLLPAVSHTSL